MYIHVTVTNNIGVTGTVQIYVTVHTITENEQTHV